MEQQPIPSAASCPYCGGDPEYDPDHVLSAAGYTHDDIHLTCADCAEEWTCGVPIGESDGELAADLFCRSCERRYGLVHRAEILSGEQVKFHLKCPNEDCHNFWTLKRHADSGVILLGYPQITGDTDRATSDYTHPRTLKHSQEG